MASIHGAVKDLRQDGPIKEPLAFGSLTHRESLPVLGTQHLLLDACHIANPVSLGGLNTDDFIGRDSQRVGEALRFQEDAQVGAVSVHGIGYHPADRQPGGLCSLDHALGQFGFGLKTDGLGDMSGLPASRVGAPVFWQVQFAIDEGVSGGGDVGEEDAHLTVVHMSGRAAILVPDSGGVGAPFGEAAFIDHEHRKGLDTRAQVAAAREWQTSARSTSRTPSSSQTARESRRCMP